MEIARGRFDWFKYVDIVLIWGMLALFGIAFQNLYSLVQNIRSRTSPILQYKKGVVVK
jgi:hypothetical protein